MSEVLRVLVHGTGFAGQGHAAAFRDCGAEIIGMVGRTDSVVTQITEEMGIPFGGTDWETALDALQPDIVTIGTPGGAHDAAIRSALARGCHVFCDKPLTADGETAAQLRDMADAAGVKTAFSASYRYMPHVRHAKRLVAGGAIGEPLEVECISHFNLERDIPFGWSHRRADGGGRLNNNFTHKLSIVTSVVGEEILAMMGEVRDDLGRAPIVSGVHNFKTRRDHIPDDLKDPSLQWGVSDVEWSYTVLARLRSPMARKPVSVLFKHGGLQPRFGDDHIVFYGSEGAIHITGHYGAGPLNLYGADKVWRELPLPDDIASSVPQVDGDTERNWRSLVAPFLADIRGEPHDTYQTFAEGAQYQQIIDIIRNSPGWVDVRHLG